MREFDHEITFGLIRADVKTVSKGNFLLKHAFFIFNYDLCLEFLISFTYSPNLIVFLSIYILIFS